MTLGTKELITNTETLLYLQLSFGHYEQCSGKT